MTQLFIEVQEDGILADSTKNVYVGTYDISASRFRDLNDTPTNYIGSAGKLPIVAQAEDSLEFAELGPDFENNNNVISTKLKIESHAMTKAEFDALAEKRIRDSAGSGFAEWGSNAVKDPAFGTPVNQGLNTWWYNSDVSDTFRLGWGGIDGHAANIGGISRTHYPIVNVHGVNVRIDGTGGSASNEYNNNVIKLPPAPDGKKTYDSATGKVTEHASAAEAFEGLVTNGDFRYGVGVWIPNGLGSGGISVTDGILRIQSDGTGSPRVASLLNVFPLVSGTTYKIQMVVRSNQVGDTTTGFAITDSDGSTTGHPIYSTTLKGNDTSWVTIEAELTADAANLTRVLIHGSSTLLDMSVASISIMPATESVITSRQDYVFIEQWHEVISQDEGVDGNKDLVVPLGNVQWGGADFGDTDIETYLFTFIDVPQGYSAFGEWDTTTIGRGRKWSTLTDAERVEILKDKSNNIYLDGDDLVQVRYRIRVVEGLGDDWENVIPWTGDSFGIIYDNLNRIRPRCKITSTSDYTGTTANYATFFGSVYEFENLEGDVGVGTMRENSNTGNLQYSDNNEAFIIPIALVQRRNQGAYHPTYNPEGTTVIWHSDNVTAATYEWHQDLAKIPTTTANCMSIGNPNAVGIYGNIGQGSIGGRSGRPDEKSHDAIYASDVLDLRMSSRRVPLTQIRESYKRKAIAGEVRGFEGVPFTRVTGQLASNSSGATAIVISDSLPQPKIGSIIYNMDSSTTYLETRKVVSVSQGSDGWNVTTDRNGVRTENGLVVYMTENKHSQANPTWTDIIGDPARIAATFPNGVEGEWIPTIPDGTPDQYTPLSRKSLDSSIGVVYSTNDGDTWDTLTQAVDTTNNTADRSWAVGVVGLLHYETQAHFTKDDVNSRVYDLGNAWCGAANDTRYGNILMPSLIGKVGTTELSGSRENAIIGEVTNYTTVETGKLDTLTNQSPKHGELPVNNLPTDDKPAIKTLDYLSSENSVGKLCYVYKEMVYASGSELSDTVTVTNNTSQAYSVGGVYKHIGTSSNINGVVIHRLNSGGTFTINWDNFLISNGEVYAVGSDTPETNWKIYDGNGWGDNNQFEIVDNQELFTDNNGNIGLRGHASFDTQFFVVEE